MGSGGSNATRVGVGTTIRGTATIGICYISSSNAIGDSILAVTMAEGCTRSGAVSAGSVSVAGNAAVRIARALGPDCATNFANPTCAYCRAG